MIKGLSDTFADFADPRRQGRIQHRFIDILIIGVCAVIAGVDSWTDTVIEPFSGLMAVFPLTILLRVFTLINPETFEQCFSGWVHGFFQVLNREMMEKPCVGQGLRVKRIGNTVQARSGYTSLPLHDLIRLKCICKELMS